MKNLFILLSLVGMLTYGLLAATTPTITYSTPVNVTVDGNVTNTVAVTANVTNTVAVTANVTNTVSATANVTNTVTIAGQVGVTNVPAVKGFLLKCVTGDTNVPVQLTTTSTLAKSLTFIGYSNRVANAAIVWIQTTNAANDVGYPLAAGGTVQWVIPAGMSINLTNFWIQAVATNEGVGVLYTTP